MIPVFAELIFLTPLVLISQFINLAVAYWLYWLSDTLTKASWCILAYHAHKAVLDRYQRELGIHVAGIRDLMWLHFGFVALLSFPSFLYPYYLVSGSLADLTSADVVIHAVLILTFTSILELGILSKVGVLAPASVAGDRNRLALVRSQNIRHCLKTIGQLLRWPGAVEIALMAIYLIIWVHASEAPKRGILSAIIRGDDIVYAVFRHFGQGVVIVLTAMVLSSRYIEVRKSCRS